MDEHLNLMRLAAAGDAQAFESMVAAMQDRLLRFAMAQGLVVVGDVVVLGRRRSGTVELKEHLVALAGAPLIPAPVDRCPGEVGALAPKLFGSHGQRPWV